MCTVYQKYPYLLCVWVCACLCVCVCVGMCVCMCVCVYDINNAYMYM